GLGDTQLALLTGVSFAVVYSIAALPLARLADRHQPRFILAGSLALWSVMTALSGLAANFVQLLACRMGVAAFEAGSTPAAHALIARSVRADRRAWGLAVFSLGVPIGSMAGLALGGWINDRLGWREAFLIVGLPGVILAAACALFLPRLAPAAQTGAPQASFGSVLSGLWRLRSFRNMTLGNTFYATASYGVNAFAPAFLMRAHELSSTRSGFLMGFVYAVGGIVGTLGGGVIADRLSRRDEAWRLRVPAIGQALALPTALGAWFVADVHLSVVLMTLAYLFGLFAFAPSFSAAQSLVPDGIRATTSAVMLFVMTLVGSSLGPLAVGAISDALAGSTGALSLRYALAALSLATVLSGLFFFLASRQLAGEVATARESRGA
ncbi:MAG TPA: MFS transporter, partial [Novosphingobium sp.]|nr:MFS transporter [Novosphingobium sp.]